MKFQYRVYIGITILFGIMLFLRNTRRTMERYEYMEDVEYSDANDKENNSITFPAFTEKKLTPPNVVHADGHYVPTDNESTCLHSVSTPLAEFMKTPVSCEYTLTNSPVFDKIYGGTLPALPFTSSSDYDSYPSV